MIIGIGGEKQHGKDTVANYLVSKYGYTKKAFADRLKEICKISFPEVNIYDEQNKETPFEQPIAATKSQIESILDEVISGHGYNRIPAEVITQIYNVFLDKVCFRSVRDILQFVGTDILRNLIDEDFHYFTVANSFKSIENGVVSDCRFANERMNLHIQFSHRCRLIKVVRPSKEKNSSSKHASENSLGKDEEYDHIIINDGTLEDLYNKVDKIMEEL
jgi:hypothetical protein